MSPEERDIIGRFIARVGGAGHPPGGSVPATQQAALPAIDPEADRFINDQFSANPEARYRITQMAFVQEAALAEAQNRIKRLEYDLGQARQQAQASAQSNQGQSRGFLGGLFGGGSSQPPPQPAYQQQYAPPPPQASYPPGYRPGMFGGGGSGFLGSALTTAAGVAGGVLAADAITSMFSPHMGGGFGGGFGGGGFGGGGFGGGEVINETTVNNYGDGAASPWSDAPGAGASGGGDPFGGAGTADTGGDAWSGGDAGSNAGGGDAWGGGGASDSSFDTGGDSGSWDDGGGGGGGDGSF